MTRTQQAVADHTMTRELSILWAHRDQEHARAALVARFMPLARSLARRYERSSEPLDDLVQVASMGLVKAIDRFDPARGNAFVSFAVPTILGELRRYFRDCCWDVHVPRGAQELALRVDHAVTRLSVGQRRSPSVSEIAHAVGASDEQVLDALEAAAAYRAASLDASRSATHGEEAGESVADTLGTHEGGFQRAEERATLEPLLARLSPRERVVLRLRFGADLTQAEIGERIGVSQMQVSRLIRQALARMRAGLGGGGGPG